MSRGFSLFCRRFLAITLAALAVAFLCRSEQMRDQRQAVRSLKQHKNLIVHYDYQRKSAGGGTLMHYNDDAKPRAPRWVRKLLGDDFLYDVAFLEVAQPYPPQETVDDFLNRLPDCPIVYR